MLKTAAIAMAFAFTLGACGAEEEESVEERFKRTEAAIMNTADALEKETENAVRATEELLENQAETLANSIEDGEPPDADNSVANAAD